MIKKAILSLARRAGYDIVRLNKSNIGEHPFSDMQHFLKEEDEPVLFDLGGNIGQTVDRFRAAFPKSRIHTFEPSPSTYSILKPYCDRLPGVSAWRYGIGSGDTKLPLLENSSSVMSSFLEPNKAAGGKVVKSSEVDVITLDSFAEEHKIEFIHVLKSDTQGYELEVFKGASRLMKENRIGLIYFEFTFLEMYKGQPSFYDVFKYLSESNFALVAFYEQHFVGELLGWADVIFINRHYKKKKGRLKSTAAQI